MSSSETPFGERQNRRLSPLGILCQSSKARNKIFLSETDFLNIQPTIAMSDTLRGYFFASLQHVLVVSVPSGPCRRDSMCPRAWSLKEAEICWFHTFTPITAEVSTRNSTMHLIDCRLAIQSPDLCWPLRPPRRTTRHGAQIQEISFLEAYDAAGHAYTVRNLLNKLLYCIFLLLGTPFEAKSVGVCGIRQTHQEKTLILDEPG